MLYVLFYTLDESRIAILKRVMYLGPFRSKIHGRIRESNAANIVEEQRKVCYFCVCDEEKWERGRLHVQRTTVQNYKFTICLPSNTNITYDQIVAFDYNCSKEILMKYQTTEMSTASFNMKRQYHIMIEQRTTNG